MSAPGQKPIRRQLNIRLPEVVMREIEHGCFVTGLSQSKFIALCVLAQNRSVYAVSREVEQAAFAALAKRKMI